MIQVSTDEFTVVLQINSIPEVWEDWENYAEKIIHIVENNAYFTNIYGEINTNGKTPQGYTIGYQYGEHDFYFSIAYHPDQINMGIIIKFSATAWAVYQKNYFDIYGKQIHIHSFIQSIQNTEYSTRISRVDIAIDFMDENVSVHTIYNQLSKGNQVIKNQLGRKNTSTLSAIVKNNKVSTLYLGSKGKNIKSLLRIYDKKIEQINTSGHRYQEAIVLDDWTRFEASFKGHYAHRISEELLTISSNTELKDLLISSFTDRYQFYYTKSGKKTTFTNKMISLLNQRNFHFHTPSPRNNTLNQSINHLINGSGLFPTLFKIERIWDKQGVDEFINFLYEEYYNYEPNNDLVYWIKKYENLYIKQGKPFTLNNCNSGHNNLKEGSFI